MLFFWIYLIISLTIFAFSFCVGNYLVKTPPKDMYQLFGYRTQLSVRNQDTWDFAQASSGRVCRIVSITAFVLSLILIIRFKTVNGTLVFNVCSVLVLIAQLLSLSVTFPITEYLMLVNFHEDGTRKTVRKKNNLLRQKQAGSSVDISVIVHKLSAFTAGIVDKAQAAVRPKPESQEPEDKSDAGEMKAGKDENEKQIDVETKPETNTKPETDTKSETDSEPGTDKKSDTDAKPGTDTESETNTKPGTDTESETDSKHGTDGKSDTDAKPETDRKPETDTESETNSKSEITKDTEIKVSADSHADDTGAQQNP